MKDVHCIQRQPITACPSEAVQDVLARIGNHLRLPLDSLEGSLAFVTQSAVHLIPEVSRHLIFSGGKRIRPCLLLLFRSVVRPFDPHTSVATQVIDLAVVSELVHSATLLHDDVVDRGQMRRGVPSAPQIFGNSASVLVGDFLLAQALQLVMNTGRDDLLQELVRVLAGMAEGEILQLVRSGQISASYPDYIEIISGKTAGLFSWACRAGAGRLIADDVHDFSEAAAAFGQAFGMAFQIVDDVLDYVSSPETTGKDLAADLRQGKLTLPLLMACETDPSLFEEVRRVANEEAPPEASQAILQRVLASDALARSRREAQAYSDKAQQHLNDLPAGEPVELLCELCRFNMERMG